MDAKEEHYNSWGDPVYSNDTWYCQEGISHVRNWCDTLLEALTDETVISVVVGLALTVSRVASWTRVYPKEAERELSDALTFANKGQIGLACRMLWTVGLVEEAWSAVNEQRMALHGI